MELAQLELVVWAAVLVPLEEEHASHSEYRVSLLTDQLATNVHLSSVFRASSTRACIVHRAGPS